MSFEPIVPNAMSNPNSTRTKWVRMNYWLCIFFTSSFSLLISHCGLDVEDPTPPSPPVWVQKSQLEEWPERGIDAHESGGIYLEWYSNHEDDIEFYWIYRAEYIGLSDSLGDFGLLTRLKVKPSDIVEYLDESTINQATYFYKLKSEDISNNFSDFSDSLMYSIIQPIELSNMSPNGLSNELESNRRLSWYYWHSIELEEFVLTILTNSNELVSRQVFHPDDYLGGYKTYIINDSIPLETGEHYKWRIDICGRYVNGLETSSSESGWATFLYIKS
jgi:hypothetical protein